MVARTVNQTAEVCYQGPGRSNVFLGVKRNLNKGLLNVFKENKTKSRKNSHKFPQLKVILYGVRQTLNTSILFVRNRTLVCHIVRVYPLPL